ncbi:unnamed protein product [Rhodiola kirilowii]
MDQNMVVVIKGQDDQEIDLPPGFRFHPTDEELITHYLIKKISDDSFVAVAIGEADLNKCEPWDLPGKAKMGENEWYFFVLRDKKYPTGLRTNRATEAGYWKATGKDKEIFRGKSLIGMKKTLVFYRGRAPKGVKSNWVMHEYRLEGKLSAHNLPRSAKTEWVISRVFEKSSNGKKIYVPGMSSLSSFEAFMSHSQLPPLTDFSQPDEKFNSFSVNNQNVSCFSNQTDLRNSYNINNDRLFRGQSNSNPVYIPGNYQFPGSFPGRDHPMMRPYLDNNGWQSIDFQSGKAIVSVSQETGLTSEMNANLTGNEISSVVSDMAMGRQSFEDGSGSGFGVGPMDLECLWPY